MHRLALLIEPRYCCVPGVLLSTNLMRFWRVQQYPGNQLLRRCSLTKISRVLLMRTFFAFRAKKPLHTGVRTGCHSVFVSVCASFVVFTDCESWSRPIYTNPGSMEAGECGLSRGACFTARRLELVAVAWRL